MQHSDLPVITGIMSGTSLDGLDLASVKFIKKDVSYWSYDILASECFAYDNHWKKKLAEAHLLNGKELIKLDLEYGRWMGHLINNFHSKYNIKAELIASHGHTIFHDPAENMTFQAGNGAAITAITGISTITSFRDTDVQLGGQGAPLVPVGDLMIFPDFNPCLNLGGIANITIKLLNKIIAFDICPCNLILNYAASNSGNTYDKDGELASYGKVNSEFLKSLDAFDYYRLPTPKSLDKEKLMHYFVPLIDNCRLKTNDILATIVEHISNQITVSIEKLLPFHIRDQKKMLVCGGGTFNKSLIKNLEEKSPVSVYIPSAELVNFKEALVFAFLGLLHTLKQPNCLSDITGAIRNNCGGARWEG